MSFDRRVGSAVIGHSAPKRDKGRAACDENPADWYADCGSQQYIHSPPDFTSVPDLSNSEVEQVVFDELEPCKIARDEQLENESTITYEIEYAGSDVWLIHVSSEQQALSYGNCKVDTRTASEITPLDVEADDVVFNGSRCATSEAAPAIAL
ncbi:MAG TPA: hypothetical protein EYQ34_07455 [Acidimicrobiia bacterium]|nr:hypothetical protein [Acidimicrobiia bacterium]